MGWDAAVYIQCDQDTDVGKLLPPLLFFQATSAQNSMMLNTAAESA